MQVLDHRTDFVITNLIAQGRHFSSQAQLAVDHPIVNLLVGMF
jgi:hypothetical protein